MIQFSQKVITYACSGNRIEVEPIRNRSHPADKRKRYPSALAGYGGRILLVGISYDKKSPKNKHRHTCIIEEI